MTEEPRFLDRAVYLPASDALVVADLHVGQDRRSNVELSMGEREDLADRLRSTCDACEPETVVVAGDLLHSFDTVPDGVEGTVDALRSVVDRAGGRLVVVRGNHDPMIDAVYDGPVHDAYRLADGDTVVCHGHERPEVDAGRYVIGHDHPTIEIQGRRHPCFLLGRGTYEGADVLVVPAFSRLPPGLPVNGASGRDLLSPMVDRLDRYRPVVVDAEAGETLRFPPLGEFRRLL